MIKASPADRSVPPRSGWGLMLFALVLLFCPSWQSFGTGQSSGAAQHAAIGTAAELPVAGGASAGDCLGFARPAGDGGQIITLINTSLQWMAVYHVDGAGQIHLIGSRPLNQDFAVQYNAVAPLPEEIRRIAKP